MLRRSRSCVFRPWRARHAWSFLLFFADLIHHVLAQVVVGHAEFLPPVGQRFIHLANL